MSSHFSANQYEDAFNPKKLKNWTVPRKHKERPSTLEGFTQIIATDRGHLKSAIPRSTESPWGTFMGTWDMPINIPPARPSYTARSNRAAKNLRCFKETSPLNNAVNGYKEFSPGKSSSMAPLQKVTTPVKSPVAEALQPSGAVKKSPTPRSRQNSPLEPNAELILRTPSPRKSTTPEFIEDLQSPVASKPPSVHSQRLSPPLSERPQSHKSEIEKELEMMADAC